MDLLNLVARLTLDKKDYEDGLRDSERDASSIGSKIGSAIGTIGKVSAVGLGVAAAAVGKLTWDATGAYKSYEQLVGGVETLFGTGGKSLEEYAASVGKTAEEAEGDFNNYMYAQQTVLENADKAFDTAGMSVNEYMETVTGFAASLIQSMGGDTLEAAKKADMAISDMSDNANKMGTSMESIQYAYSGFAKQNYTMLDNLKLGYGGTKEEMERLLVDAQNLKAAQGEYVEYSIDSYADVVDAIHVVQTELGITGTTAKEGASTVEGSGNRMKAAWQNVVTNFRKGGGDLSRSTKQFIDSAKAYINNLVPVVSGVLKGIGQFIEEALPTVFPTITRMISDFLPDFLASVTSLVRSTVRALPGMLVEAIPAIMSIIPRLGDALPEELKKYILPAFGSLREFFNDIFKGEWGRALVELQNLVHNAFEGVSQFVFDQFAKAKDLVMGIDWIGLGKTIITSITSVLGTIVESTKNFFISAKEGIETVDWGEVGRYIANFFITSFETIKNGIMDIDWIGLGTSILDFIKTAFDSAVDLFGAIFTGVWNYIQTIDWLGLGASILDFIISAFANIGEWALEKFGYLADVIKTVDWVAVGTAIWDFIISAFSNVAEWALEKFQFLGDVIKSVDWLEVGNKIWDTIISAFSNVWEWAQEKFNYLGDAIKSVDWENVGSTIWEAIKKGFSMIVDWGHKVGDRIETGINSINWHNLGESVWNKIKEFAGILTSTDNPIITFGSSVGDKIREGIANIKWIDLGKNLWAKIKEGVLAINADGLATINFGEWLGAKIREKLFGDSNLNIWSYAGQQIWAKIKEGWGFVSANTGAVWEWAKKLGENIRDTIGGIQWGQLGTDIWNAIKGGFTSVKEFFTDLFSFDGIHVKVPKLVVKEYKDIPFIGQIPWDLGVEWVQWFAKAYSNPYLFKSPGVMGGYGFGDLGGILGGEMVYSHDKLMNDIRAASGGGNNITINVYQQPGEDSEELAERISQIMNDDYSRGQVVYG